MDSLIIKSFVIAVAASSSLMLNEAVADIELSGFLQTNTAVVNIEEANCSTGTECEMPFNNQRVQLKAENGNDSGSMSFYSKLDLFHDSVLGDNNSDLREFYIDFNFEDISLRTGRQIITWGVGDLLFINDIFPKDWVAFYSGQPLEYLKKGSDSVKLDFFFGSTTLEFIVSDFREDRLPDNRQFVFASPFSITTPRSIIEPDKKEAVFKMSDNVNGWDVAYYMARGFYHMPALTDNTIIINGVYPALNTTGLSFSGAVLNGVLNVEAGYYDSVDDRQGIDPVIENSQARLLAGYSRQIGSDTQIGVQLYGEMMQDYENYKSTLPVGFNVRDEVRSVITMRFTQNYFYQTITFNLFAFWGISDEDSYVIPSLRYAFSDNLWAELGANVFSGEITGMFGFLGRNDNVFFNLRHSF
jgi:hypothetical protein